MIYALALLSLAPATQDAGTDAPDWAAAIEPALVELVATHRLPAPAVGVVADGQVIYARGFGSASRGSDRAVTPESIFHMASVSKPFVATAVKQLVEDGKMELDAPIVEYLPYFRLADERYKEITVRQDLTHTSGIPGVQDYEWDRPQGKGACECP